eukprot:CAMPEP_0180217524 /NCGR_PEP_ID=MMETSP0987-20121128/17008_1 /TAXON_ID=697907 /ORGANISM="non described non described, Strain CCMP2293" /LENGTH=75 /DNA_ID=CAMNT_0022177121 /DNA_START=73 /DNA_END=297 /DNA_ORIENTATION=-
MSFHRAAPLVNLRPSVNFRRCVNLRASVNFHLSVNLRASVNFNVTPPPRVVAARQLPPCRQLTETEAGGDAGVSQ